MKKALFPLLLLLTALCLTCPFAAADAGVRYVDGGNADRVHLRQGASRTEASLGLYYTGTGVTVCDERGGWCHVRIGEADGWMMSEYLTADFTAQLGPWRMAATAANLRIAPQADSAVTRQIPNGGAVHLLGETSDGWSYVEFGGTRGYVPSECLAPTGIAADIAVLGTTADGRFIHCCTMPGGQTFCFTAAEEAPLIALQDVNFDGMTDAVAYVCLGASNFYTELFVYDPGEDAYVRAEHPGIDYDLCNIELYPEYGMVASRANNGDACALFEDCLFRWEGTNLVLVRRAVSEELTETTLTDGVLTTTWWTDVLRVRVWDDMTGDSGGTLTYDATFLLEDAVYSVLLTEVEAALWQGIR